MPTRRHLITALTSALGSVVCLASATTAFAQAPWPSKSVKLIVPFAAGGPVDQIARTIAPALSKELGQTVVVDNKAGAGGSIGLDAAIKGEADGHTIGFGVPGAITVLPHLQKMPYQLKDINYVSLVARVPQVLAVGPQVPVKSLQELVALAKASPGKLNFASAGNATTPHLGGELLRDETGIQIVHVPYKGAAPALTALLAGEVQIFCGDLPAILPFTAKGVKILAINGSQRVEALPGVPTTAELGFPAVKVESNYGIVAPTGMPAAHTQRLHAALMAALAQPEVRKQLVSAGSLPMTTTAQEYRQLMEQESAKWGALVKKSNIKLD